MIPQEVLDVIHETVHGDTHDLAIEWYIYIESMEGYLGPSKFKMLKEESGADDFPKDPFKYEQFGKHLEAYSKFWLYMGSKEYHTPMNVVQKAKAYSLENLKHNYNRLLEEVKSLEYNYYKLQHYDLSKFSDLARRKIIARIETAVRKKKLNFKDELYTRTHSLERAVSKLSSLEVSEEIDRVLNT